ncbi:MAG: carbon-nitrogen hydrolase family protein [Ignavibacteriae bacterium]|nr:carbon-nitrogen hydrolase family protein [Ignavibacteriota bacterium]
MKKRIIRVSAIQLPAEVEGAGFAEKQRKNVREIRAMLATAGKRKSDLVLLGEYANLHHRAWSTRKSEYVPDDIPGPFTRAIATIAKQYRMNVVIPMFGRYENVLSSFAVIIDRKGSIVGCAQKTHPHEQEQAMGIVPGNELPVFSLDCVKIGLMTCMDIEYPEVAQVLMLKGAEVLLFPHVQAGWGEVDWEIRYRARAIDTGLYVVSACYGYTEGVWKPGKMIGRSGVVGRDGLILADIGRDIGVLTFDMDLNQKRVTHFFFTEKFDRTTAVIASRRPELYHELTESSSKQIALRLLKRSEK